MNAKATLLWILATAVIVDLACTCFSVAQADAETVSHQVMQHEHGVTDQSGSAHCTDECDCGELQQAKPERSKAAGIGGCRQPLPDDSGDTGFAVADLNLPPRSASTTVRQLDPPLHDRPVSTPVSRKDRLLD